MKFFNSYSSTIDERGRIAIPFWVRSGAKTAAVQVMILTYGRQGALFLFTPEGWEQYEQDILSEAQNRSDKFRKERKLYRWACQVKVDRSWRFVIPDELRCKAELGETVVIKGVRQKIEIWNPEYLTAYDDGDEQTPEEDIEDMDSEAPPHGGD
jgi:MraZ protein